MYSFRPCLVLCLLAFLTLSATAKDYPLRLQPELDVIDVESYLNNPRLLDLQVKCLLFDGPCDAVGRWAKPRVKAGLLGQCLLCTEKQKGWLDTWLDKLIKQYPDLYRAAVAKYIQNTGIPLPQSEVAKLQKTLDRFDNNVTSSSASHK